MESKKKKAGSTHSLSESYDQYKIYKGQQYTGMKIGRSHKWYYDKGIWYDKKITPDKWLINYEVTKRRAGNAPEGSGVPVGTEYHWFILAHQLVRKLNANDYTTAMNGLKFKLAHKRSDKNNWNASDKAQRKNLVKILKGFIKELEKAPIEEFVKAESNLIKPAKPAKTGKKELEQPKKKTAKKKKELVLWK